MGKRIGVSITSIENFTFENWTSLQRIILPDSVTSIGNSAFSNCQNLEQINLDNIESIGDSAFSDCQNLRGLTAWTPDRFNILECKSIGSNAFSNCSGLTIIGLDGSTLDETFLGDSVFSGCYAISKVTINHT